MLRVVPVCEESHAPTRMQTSQILMCHCYLHTIIISLEYKYITGSLLSKLKVISPTHYVLCGLYNCIPTEQLSTRQLNCQEREWFQVYIIIILFNFHFHLLDDSYPMCLKNCDFELMHTLIPYQTSGSSIVC